ncbi:MAG: hypothetical protein M3075_10785 [Candidatus Dormibacteraeota bacterium]|jgi:hypothetical protein|nr:hypothetical protein [Candidatus Dormibacteraeota bacterium]
MSKKYVVALTIGLAIPTFVLSRVIWPDPPGAPVPPKGLLPFLIVPAVFESLAFGAGVAFLIAAGRGLLGNTGVGGLAVAAYASAGWALVSWWPHSNMHRVNTSFQGLIVIDWTFHLTLIAGAAIIGVFLYRMVGREQGVARRESGESTRLLDAEA